MHPRRLSVPFWFGRRMALEIDEGVLVSNPAFSVAAAVDGANVPLSDTIKESLSDPRYRTRLRDRIAAEVRVVREALSNRHFPVNVPISREAFTTRARV